MGTSDHLTAGPAQGPTGATTGPLASAIGRVQGAWVRQGLALGDGPFREMSDASWLQVGRYFVDLRVPRRATEGGRRLGGNVLANALNAARAFSGTVSGEGDRLAWQHDLDTMAVRPDRDDVAVVLRFGDLLLQAGPGYVERWYAVREGSEDGRVFERRSIATGAVDVRLVQIADLAAAVWAVPARGGARLERLPTGSWILRDRVGAQPLSTEVETRLPGSAELARVLAEPAGEVWSGRGDSRWAVVPV